MNYDTTKNKVRYLFEGIKELDALQESLQFNFEQYASSFQTAESVKTTTIKKILSYDTEWITCSYALNEVSGFDVPVYYYEFHTYLYNFPTYLMPGIKTNVLWKNTSDQNLKCVYNNMLFLATQKNDVLYDLDIVNGLLLSTTETPTEDITPTQVFTKLLFRIINPLILR